jgi:hypothetical protein
MNLSAFSLFLLLCLPLCLAAQPETNTLYKMDSACFTIAPDETITRWGCGDYNFRPNFSLAMSDEEGLLQFYMSFQFLKNPPREPARFFTARNEVIPNSTHFFRNRWIPAQVTAMSCRTGYYVVRVNNAARLEYTHLTPDLQVDRKEIQIAPDSVLDRIGLIRHPDGEDWWLIAHRFRSDSFLVYRYTSALDDFILWDSQPVDTAYLGALSGDFSASAAGDRFVLTGNGIAYRPDGLSYRVLRASVYDFDPCTGRISLFANLEPEFRRRSFLGALAPRACLSASGQVLYVTTGEPDSEDSLHLNQVDLTTVFDPQPVIHRFPLLTKYLGLLQMERNHGTIISGTGNNQGHLAVVRNPEVVGPGCGFDLRYHRFPPNPGYEGLPNYVSKALPVFACFAPRGVGAEGSAGASRAVEPCDTVQLGVPPQPHLAYAWTTDPPGAWLSCTACAQPRARPDTLTRYYLTVTDTTLNRDCAASTHKVRLRFAPPATSPDTALCPGDTAWLRARVATPGTVFTWQPGNLTGGTVAVAPLRTTTYTVTAQRPNCTITTTDSVLVVVRADTAAACAIVNRPVVAAGRVQLRVYPNPTRGTLTIETPHAGHWHLTTALGQRVHALDLPAGRTEVQLGTYPPGLYLGLFTPHTANHPPIAVKVQKE